MNDSENPNANPGQAPNDSLSDSPASSQNHANLSHEETNTPNDGESDPLQSFLEGARPIEIGQFTVNAVLAVIGIFAICIYRGQLNVMQGQLTEMHNTTELTRKEMEGVSAAIVEFRQAVPYVSISGPPEEIPARLKVLRGAKKH